MADAPLQNQSIKAPVTSWVKLCFRPRFTLSIFAICALLLATFALLLGFNEAIHRTNTESFCISCHEMENGPFQLLQNTTHFKNRSGVRPTCPDCHVPKPFIPKMIRKVEASREVWGHLIGRISTPEKYLAHAREMKDREIARMRASDSATCRNCHEVKSMQLELQSPKAQEYHQLLTKGEKTCIDCHQGIAHTPESTLWPELPTLANQPNAL